MSRPPSAKPIVVDGILDGDGRTIADICGATLCVADLVELPDRRLVEIAVDLEMPETLAALSIERITSDRTGVFGRGWVSVLDLRLEDGRISGPLPSRPADLSIDPRPGNAVRLVDGSSVSFDEVGRLERLCPIGAICATIDWSDDEIIVSADEYRPTATGADDAGPRSVRLDLVDDRVAAVSSSDGRVMRYSYDGERLVNAGPFTYAYDGADLLSVMDTDGTRTFRRDGIGSLVGMVDRDGDEWTLAEQITDVGRRVHVTGPDLDRRHDFTTSGRHIGTTDATDGVLLERAIVNGELFRERRPFDGVTMTLLRDGRYEIVEESVGTPDRRALIDLDVHGRVVRSDEYGIVTTFAYDELGRRTVLTRAGASTTYQYDEAGLLASISEADGYETHALRNSDGAIVRIDDGSTSIQLEYDAAGRTIDQQSGDTARTATYDDAGRLIATDGPEGNETYRYDAPGRLEGVTAESGPTSSIGFAASGEVLPSPVVSDDDEPAVAGIASSLIGDRYRYDDGSAITFDFDGRPIEIEKDGRIERRTYGDDGLLATLVDPFGRQFDLTRDAAGRLAELIIDGLAFELEWDGPRLASIRSLDAIGDGPLEVAYAWDAAGLLAEVTANEQTWTYEREGGYLTRIVTPHGSMAAQWRGGQPIELTGSDGGTTKIEWDSAGIRSVDGPDGQLEFIRTGGRLTSIKGTDSEGSDAETVASYEYDSIGRLVRATLRDRDVMSLRHDPSGLVGLCEDDRCERWERNEDRDVVSVVSVDSLDASPSADDQPTDVVIDGSGRLLAVERDGMVLAEASTDELGRIVQVTDGDGESVADLEWSGVHLRSISADLDDIDWSIERDRLGQVSSLTVGDDRATFRYDGARPTEIRVGDLGAVFEMQDGQLARSSVATVDGEGHEKVVATLEWADGDRVEGFAFEADDGESGTGSFSYDDGRVDRIRYDNRDREVTSDDSGVPAADGTGSEFLDDLFDDAGRFVLGPNLPETAPVIPLFERLPPALGLDLPRPLTADNVVALALDTAQPAVPQLLLGEGSPGKIAASLAASAIVSAGSFGMPTAPAQFVQLSPIGSADLDWVASSATWRAAASVIDRLGPDPGLFERVRDLSGKVVGGVLGSAVATARFLVDSTVGLIVDTAIWLVAGSAASVCVPCAVAVFAAGNLIEMAGGPASVPEFLATVADLFVSALSFDLSGADALVAISILGPFLAQAPVLRTSVRRVFNAVTCGLRRIVCVERARFGAAADHIADAIDGGQPRVLRLNRLGASDRRRDALRDIARASGFDRDEYPPAFARATGATPSVRLIDPGANRSAGRYFQLQTTELADGARFFVRVL